MASVRAFFAASISASASSKSSFSFLRVTSRASSFDASSVEVRDVHLALRDDVLRSLIAGDPGHRTASSPCSDYSVELCR
eukprot:12271451-Heterocapsa_arctica.AAC.1